MKRARAYPRSLSMRLLAAGLAVIGVIALGYRIGLRHVLAALGLAVPLIGGAVVDLAAGIDPDQAGSTAGRLRHRRRRAALAGLRRGRSRRCGRGRCRRSRCGRRCSSGRCSSRCRGGSGPRTVRGGIPILNPLVSMAGASLRSARPIRAVLAQARGPCRSTGRRCCLRHRNRRTQYTCSQRKEFCSVKHHEPLLFIRLPYKDALAYQPTPRRILQCRYALFCALLPELAVLAAAPVVDRKSVV